MNAGRVAAAVVVAIFALATGAAARPSAASDIFRVRPDPRLCPSPLCGGFFVRRVNRPTTACADGTMRPWCYVAEIDLAALPTSVRARVQAAEQDGSLLVRGRIVKGGTPEFRTLGRLVAQEAWLAATSAAWNGIVFLVSDTGVRCVRAPCFSLRASILNTTRAVKASGLDLAPVAAPPGLARKAQAALTTGGLLLAGTTRRDTDGGRTVVASQFFLRTG